MIKAGLVKVNSSLVRASSSIRAGDRIEIASPPTRESATTAEPAPPIELLFADSEVLVVNKPAGMTVHPAPAHPRSTLVDALVVRFPELIAMADADGRTRPGIVHRLDKETSGVMVVARTPFARMALSQQFKQRAVNKFYLAIVRGTVARERFTIMRPLGRHPTERKRMSIHSRHPRAALTQFRVLQRFGGATLLGVRPETGRTHQIRVHLAAAGHPCLGDPLYGGARKAAGGEWPEGRQALHALSLTIAHPRSGERLEFIAPIPDDMRRFINARGLEIQPSTVRQWLDAE